MGYHLMFFVVSVSVTVAVSPGRGNGTFADSKKNYSWDDDYHNQLNQPTNKVDGDGDETENYNIGQPDRSDEEEIKGILNMMDTVDADDAGSFVSLLNVEHKENEITLTKPDEQEYEEDKGSLSDFGLVNPSDESNYFEEKEQNQIFNAADGSGLGDPDKSISTNMLSLWSSESSTFNLETHAMNPIQTTMNWCDVLNHVQGEDAPRASGCCDILTKGLTNGTDRARLQECFALHYKYVIGDADDMIENVMRGRRSTSQPTCRFRGKAKLLYTICCVHCYCMDWGQYRLQNQCNACRRENLCPSCHADAMTLSG